MRSTAGLVTGWVVAALIVLVLVLGAVLVWLRIPGAGAAPAVEESDLPAAGVQGALPPPAHPPLTVDLLEDGRVIAGGRAVGGEDLSAVLRAHRLGADPVAGRRFGPLRVRAHRRARWRALLPLLREAARQGFGEVRFAVRGGGEVLLRLPARPLVTQFRTRPPERLALSLGKGGRLAGPDGTAIEDARSLAAPPGGVRLSVDPQATVARLVEALAALGRYPVLADL